jgi:hypothetical protein
LPKSWISGYQRLSAGERRSFIIDSPYSRTTRGRVGRA